MTEHTQETTGKKFFQLAKRLWGGLEERMVQFKDIDLVNPNFGALGIYYVGRTEVHCSALRENLDIFLNPLVKTQIDFSPISNQRDLDAVYVTTDYKLSMTREYQIIRREDNKDHTEIVYSGRVSNEIPGDELVYVKANSWVFPFDSQYPVIMDIVSHILNNGEYTTYFKTAMGVSYGALGEARSHNSKLPPKGKIIPLQYQPSDKKVCNPWLYE